MQLTMTVLRCPDAVAPETRSVPGGEFSIGRGPGVDWVLPDPERLLSKRHFVVAYRGGTWQLADTSTNGTFMNREADAIGAGDVRSLRDGDRLRLGAYEIEVRLLEEAAQRPMSSGSMGRQPGSSPFADPFAMDPFASPRQDNNPFDEVDHPSIRINPQTAQLPHDFDPLAPEPSEMPFRGPTQADHSSAIEDAFRPPAQIGQTPLHSGGLIPGDDLLPDDWDKDLLEGIAPAGGAPHPVPAPPPPAPVLRAEPPPLAQPPAEPLEPSPFAASAAQQPVPPPIAALPPVAAPAPTPPRRSGRRHSGQPPTTALCSRRSSKASACTMRSRTIPPPPCWPSARHSAPWSRDCVPC